MKNGESRISKSGGHLTWKDTCLLAVLASIHLFTTLKIASGRALWYDEYYAHYIGRLSSLLEIWRALSNGADNHPPLNYWLTHLSYKNLGESLVTIRLHSAIAVCLGLISLYIVVKNISRSTLAACLAFILPLTTPLYYYGYEARGYALLFCLSATLLLGWVMHLRGMRVGLVGIAFSSFLLPYSHFYGVLSALPFVLTEVFFLYREKRLMNVRLVTLVASFSASLVSLLPIILSAKQYATPYFWHPAYFLPLFEEVYTGLFPALGFMVATLGLLLLSPKFRVYERQEATDETEQKILLCTTLFLALPLFQFVLARFITKAFYFRYGLPTLIAVSVLPPTILAYHRARPLILALLFITFGIAAYTIRSGFITPHRFIAGSKNTAELARAAGAAAGEGEGYIIVNGFELPAVYDELRKEEIEGRVAFVLDQERDLTPNPPAMRGLATVSGIKIIGLREVLDATSLTLVNPPSWLTKELEAAGRQITLEWSSNDDYVFSSR